MVPSTAPADKYPKILRKNLAQEIVYEKQILFDKPVIFRKLSFKPPLYHCYLTRIMRKISTSSINDNFFFLFLII